MENLQNMVNDSITEKLSPKMEKNEKNKLKTNIITLAGALTSLLTGFIYQKLYPSQDVVLSFIYLIGILIIGIPILVTSIKGFLRNDPDASMEILVSIAMLVCVVNDQYVVAILIPVILTFVHFLEEKSIVGGKDAVDSLKKMQTNEAIILKDGEEQEVDAKTLKVGDLILVKAGMSLPIDGTIEKGCSSIDQQSLTGESTPVYVEKGNKVFAGTVNIDGVLTVKVDKTFEDTSFQQIVSLLEETQNISIPETKIVDQFLMYYIPFSLIIATIVWIFSQDVNRAVAVLVVSCPCGYMLVSSAPMLAAFASATKRGVIIKNSSFIETLGDVKALVFDKTGTITKGILQVVDVHLDQAKSEKELLETAAIVACNSLHPTSKSLMDFCQNEYQIKRKSLAKDYDVKEEIGKGLIGTKGRNKIILGNTHWLKSLGYEINEELAEDGACSWIVKNKKVLGCVIFKDIARDDASETIQNLKAMGIEKTVLLTGDNQKAASRIKNDVNLDEMYCQMLPEQKLERVKKIKKHSKVAVIGDGINDALALSAADVGIAMGAMGSDTAIQSADIALMNNSLENIPFVIELSRMTKKIILQNIVIAFATSFVMIFLAASGVISAIAGALFHNIGAFIILLNSGRILRAKNLLAKSSSLVNSSN